ncbi:MAG: hypothetical protein KF686_08245 [Ramlibacter sp.]|nr:hypothetical protein [Ramlibacter sp.]
MFTWALGGLLACAASVGGGYYFGLADGRASERAHADAAALADLTQMIKAHSDLVKRAGEASKALRQATAQRAEQDAQSTLEIKNALQATAGDRVNCLFPAGVMLQLTAARDRAAAGAANGVRGALPSAAAGSADHR